LAGFVVFAAQKIRRFRAAVEQRESGGAMLTEQLPE
tara:strand:+ start:108 stop:215 length:108 start_codon:yes stop_codon:yes gene_type:complete